MAAVTSLEDLHGRRVYVDANVFIYFLAGSPAWGGVSGSIFEAAREGRITSITGDAAVAEVMAGLYRVGDQMMIRSAREFFAQPQFVDVVGHPASVWDDTAMLRGEMGMPMIDALHVATAARSRCEVVVTNDERMKPALGVDVVPLSSLV
jgi:predicted nucleic acid-binding protein